jgi:hypothetical protein
MLHNIAYSQVTYKTIQGLKAKYSVEIPSNYSPKEATGSNVDLKYVNAEGASFNVVVASAGNANENDIEKMLKPSDSEWKDMLESRGMENVKIIKRGIIPINGRKSYFVYYRNSELYFHSIMQIRSGKYITLSFTCLYEKKDLYFASINRVVNSLN